MFNLDDPHYSLLRTHNITGTVGENEGALASVWILWKQMLRLSLGIQDIYLGPTLMRGKGGRI